MEYLTPKPARRVHTEQHRVGFRLGHKRPCNFNELTRIKAWRALSQGARHRVPAFKRIGMLLFVSQPENFTQAAS